MFTIGTYSLAKIQFVIEIHLWLQSFFSIFLLLQYYFKKIISVACTVKEQLHWFFTPLHLLQKIWYMINTKALKKHMILNSFKQDRLPVCSPKTYLSEGKLNFFQCSSLGLRDKFRYKSNSYGSYYCVDCKCPCRHSSQHCIDIDISI